MSSTIYCPYTDSEILASDSNKEHIIPLSLGGSNGFCLPVSASYNSRVGSDIDGQLAKDLLVLFRRREFDARGHSGAEVKVVSRHSSFVESGRPVQVEFSSGNGFKVFDPIERRFLSNQETAGKSINSKFTISTHGRLKFAAKVALSGGYFVFGDWFRNNVNHRELRALMEFGPTSRREDFEGFGLKAYDEFSATKEDDLEQCTMDKLFCEVVQGSCVYFIPGPENLGVIVGILGNYMATLNVPANTDNFPFTDENDLGHAVVIKDRRTIRISYRELAKKVYDCIK